MTIPIRHLLPLTSEVRWSDLLAVLIEADPAAASAAFGLRPPLQQARVRREVTRAGRDRGDLHVDDERGRLRAVVEVKVLAGLSRGQLGRYRQAWPGAEVYAVLTPQRLPVHVAADAGWTPLTWERVLAAFAASTDGWVARTAAAWLEHLQAAIPPVSATTRWSDLREGEDFVVGLRTRMSWVYGALEPPVPIEYDLVESTAGVSWVARMTTPARGSNHLIRVEAEENLPVRDFPKYASSRRPAARGPSVKVCLVQTGVRTSAGFCWDYLLALWPLMAARSDWVTAPARPRAPHDREGWQRMVAAGGPPYLGIGFGESQAKRAGECMFGARLQLPPDVALEQVVAEMASLVPLMLDMAAVEPPAACGP